MADNNPNSYRDFFGNQSEKSVPFIALRDTVVFPRIAVPIVVRRKKSVASLEYTMKRGRMLALAAQKDADNQDSSFGDIYHIGSLAKIRELVKQSDGSVRVLVEGIARVRIKGIKSEKGTVMAVVSPFPEPSVKKTERIEALMYSVLNQFRRIVNMGANVPFDVLLVILNVTDPWMLGDLIASNIDMKTDEKQRILEAESVDKKLDKVSSALGRQVKVLQMASRIQAETGKELDKMQREMFLREQMKSIEKELEHLGGAVESDELKDRIEKAGMPPEVKARALKEYSRFKGMPSFSPEISYLRTYLEWLCDLPWKKADKKMIDMVKAKKGLDDDHYGLEKAKERMLEYLAVQKLVGKIKGPILCFVGPPGTGKTSIGKSIARALNRKFYRMSLGGVRDEAEIRGHRRTYVGALPGRIIQGIATVKTRNPVFMLDEIDKVGVDFRGDPSAALLEALDPEQNNMFSDHYLEVPFDLSDTLFITTANLLDPVPPALRDRMEVIEFPGYTEEEKFQIARRFLVPKSLENNGLMGGSCTFCDDALREIIRSYTQEAGVRNLERSIASICRKVARKVAEGRPRRPRKKTMTVGGPAHGRGPAIEKDDKEREVPPEAGKVKAEIGKKQVAEFLGPAKFTHALAEEHDQTGVVTGLAWTEAGGEILQVEATRMPGKGELILTGHLGKVMQESAKAASTYARSVADSFGIKDAFKDFDVHIHVPSGAIPKDGPSAGIAMAAAVISMLTGRKVKRQVGMSGEITLRGRVLEIGGVKEKVLAAHRSGLKIVMLPRQNEKDLVDIPDPIRKSIKFVFVDDMDDVLKVALAGGGSSPRSRGASQLKEGKKLARPVARKSHKKRGNRRK